MREKDYNTGLRGVLFEAQHHARMGAAIWLYGWLVLRQTHQTGTTGWVLGGAPISYREIEEETGFNRRTLERWMRLLRKHDYIATEAAQGGVIVRILKAKKHGRSSESARPARNVAEGVRKDAGRSPQNCVAVGRKIPSDQRITSRISSSSVVRIKERIEQSEIHTPVENFASPTRDQAYPNNASPKQDTSQEITDCERLAFRQQFEKLLQKNSSKNSRSDQTSKTSQNHNPQRQLSHTQNHNQTQRPADHSNGRPPTQQQFPWELRARMRLLRAERDEEVRRELAVGTGPEVQRP
ncbi:MAG: hypothetical protein WAN14_07570 [Candidatus Acidiferrales bacterium]